MSEFLRGVGVGAAVLALAIGRSIGLQSPRRSKGGRTLKMGGQQGRGDPPFGRSRFWHLQFAGDGEPWSDGQPWVWNGPARDHQHAVQQARKDLKADFPDFPEDARLTVCVER